MNPFPFPLHRHAKPLLLILSLFIVLLAAGCQPKQAAEQAPAQAAGQTSGQAAGQPAEQAAKPSADSAGQKRVVKHLAGETTITGTPQKIAVLDYRLADSLHALGVKPHAMTTYLGSTALPYIEGSPFSQAIPLGDTPNLEALVQAAPDLIIARKTEEKVYDQLTKIAPTVLVDIPADWREGLREMGRIVQREQEADKWLADYDKKAASIREELKQSVKPGETFVYLRVMPKEIRLHGTKELFGATLFQDLQLTPVAGLDKLQRIETIALEKLPDYNADYIFLEVGTPAVGGDKQANDNLATVSQTAVWKSLKAVQNNHVYTMPQWVISDYPNIKSKSLDLIQASFKQPAK
jgi:iron complex transport system substrate-binding protein